MRAPHDVRRFVAAVQVDAAALRGALSSFPNVHQPASHRAHSHTLHSRSLAHSSQEWASTTDQTFTWEGSAQRWPLLLDEHGAPRQEIIKAFLLWLSEKPKLPQDGVKFAQKWLMGSMQMARSIRGMEMLDEGGANKWMEVRVAAKQTRQSHG